MKQRPRQLATSGAAIAAIGFLTSASMVKDVGWLYLTFSVFVGKFKWSGFDCSIAYFSMGYSFAHKLSKCKIFT